MKVQRKVPKEIRKKKPQKKSPLKAIQKDGVGGTHEVPVLQIAGYLGAIITRNVPL